MSGVAQLSITACGRCTAGGEQGGMSSPQPTAPRLPVAAPSPVNLSPQSNYPPPLQQRPSGGAPSGGPPGGAQGVL